MNSVRRAVAAATLTLLIAAACDDNGVVDDPTTTAPQPVEDSPTTTEAEPADTTTTEPAPTTTTAPAPPEPTIAFRSGIYLVGDEIAPGIYETVDQALSLCYWERLSGLGGTFGELIANDNVTGRTIVEIKETDVAFNSSRCGDWQELEAFDSPIEEFGDGTWAVGLQIAPGRYRSDGDGLCYWERQSGFSGDFGDIISNNFTEGSSLVDISPSDVGFKTSGCGTWRRIG